MEQRWPLDVISLGGAACGVRLWKGPAGRHLTVVVKAAVELVNGARATLLPEAWIVTKDRHYQSSPGRSVEEATELAPYLARCDVTLRGHAFAPPGQQVRAAGVRLAVYRGAPLIDKKLFVYGDRDPNLPEQRAPFRRMPIDYEHAFGGKSHAANPVGRGAETTGTGALPPNVVDAADPQRPAGFAPLSRFWSDRGRLLGKTERRLADADEPELGEGFDWRYFQAAPADQQVPYLTGDEWIVLDGMHPALPRVQAQLPSMRAAAAVYAYAGAAWGPARAVELRADMLAIDADRLTAAIVWRGSILLDAGVELARLKVVGGVEVAGARVPWPDPRTFAPPRGAPQAAESPGAPGAPQPASLEPEEEEEATRVQSAEEMSAAARAKVAPFVAPGSRPFAPPPPASAPRRPLLLEPESDGAEDLSSTRTVSPADAARLMQAKATPFVAPGSRPFVSPPPASSPRPPQPPPEDLRSTVAANPVESKRAPLPFGGARRVEPEPPPVTPPPGKPLLLAPPEEPAVDLSSTFGLNAADAAKLVMAKPLPFSGQRAEPFISPSSPRAPARDASEDLTGTVALSPEALERSNRQVLPFLLARSDRMPSAPAAEAPLAAERALAVPRRLSPQVPIVNVTRLTAATAPWQVKPPQDSLTVIVKGTCDLVPGGPAALREEAEPITGDVYVDDDLQKSLVYTTDFAVMKPQADVLLTGHAVVPRGAATHAKVSLKFGGGSGPRGFERTIAVIGDRTWKRGLGGVSPGDPAPFDRMPLVYERAFGGPTYAQNPVGTCHISPASPNPTALPNLEDPARPIARQGDAPPPVCFAPISPLWRVRASKLGTYGPEWLASRWPYFPGDFDWSHFQAAPKAQQVDYLRGDEPFEIAGMHAEHVVLRGALPGVRARAFALQTEAAGGGFFEIPLRLDTVAIDVDAMKVSLVWRGLFETNDDEASELETLFIHTEDLATEPLSLEAVKQLLLEAATPSEPIAAEEPEGSLAIPPPSPVDVREAVAARLAAGEALDGADLAGASLAGLDFAGRSLAGANLKEASLQGCRMEGANLAGALLAGADLAGCDLRGASLAGADLNAAILEGAILDGADLDAADLSHAKADRASFVKVRGAAVQLASGSFAGARFDGAELPSADFTEAKLDGASFEDAVLPEVRLYFAKGEGARFDRARLDEARADDAILVKCVFAGASAPSSVWEKATLSGSSFHSANLAGASFSRAACDGVIFHAVDAPKARFARAKLPRAELLKANLLEADFERADLSGADLRGANLHGAETLKAKLAGAKLDLAIVTRSKLKRR